MLRLSTTTLDMFNKYLDGGWVTLDLLVSNIQRKFIPTRKTQGGLAAEKIIQSYDRQEFMDATTASYLVEMPLKTDTSDFYAFDFKFVKDLSGIVDTSFPFQIKTVKKYEILGYEVDMVAVIDQLEGLVVNEHKTRWGKFDFKEYMNSFQWKIYMDVFDALYVKYKVFMFDDPKGEPYKPPNTIYRCHYNGCEIFQFPRPFDVHEEIETLLADFLMFCENNDMLKYLER